MPLLKITSSVSRAREHGKLLASLSQLCADTLGKPESYLMTAIDHPITDDVWGEHRAGLSVKLA
jgi:phenylpyruvate tautomerase PptA (4-oxalocrotonate tautomerase family)